MQSPHRAVVIDGVLVPPEEAKVSVYDRGFLYGDGVFETLRTYSGEVFALEEHIERLEASARAIDIALPVSRFVLEREIKKAVRAVSNEECSIRILITRGQGPLGLDPTKATSPLRVILVEPISPPGKKAYCEGVSVITHRTERAADAAPGAKITNYLAGILAIRKAGEAGAYEALMLDAEGYIIEGTTSNFFLVIGGEILTPPKGSILPGITRSHLLGVASRLGISVRYGAIGKNDLEGAAEAFLTSTLREVIPVVRVDEITIGDGAPGPVTRRLHTAFRESVGMGGAPLPWE